MWPVFSGASLGTGGLSKQIKGDQFWLAHPDLSSSETEATQIRNRSDINYHISSFLVSFRAVLFCQMNQIRVTNDDRFNYGNRGTV